MGRKIKVPKIPKPKCVTKGCEEPVHENDMLCYYCGLGEIVEKYPPVPVKRLTHQ